jgi:hypothetical protein
VSKLQRKPFNLSNTFKAVFPIDELGGPHAMPYGWHFPLGPSSTAHFEICIRIKIRQCILDLRTDESELLHGEQWQHHSTNLNSSSYWRIGERTVNASFSESGCTQKNSLVAAAPIIKRQNLPRALQVGRFSGCP